MNRKLERLLSFALILSVMACCFLTGGVTNGNAARPASGDMQTDTPSPTTPVPAAVSGATRSRGAEEGREETVYVIADASGTPTRQISSVWLKNPDEAATITDRAALEDIQNTKGDETYTVDETGDLVWAANGNDIYYQGDSDEAPPISVHIAYTLDGKPVSPEALAGASGHLVMTFTYENDTRTFKLVDDEPAAMYQPFAVISCAVLDSAKAANVQVTNGRIINLGEQMVVAGLALPGLRESLGLDDIEGPDGEQLGVDIPETVTVSADVTDFSLLTTLTIAENSLLNDIDLDNVDSFDELGDAIDELTDASTQLVSGSSELYDGTLELSSGANALSGGADGLSSGADAIASNMGTLGAGLNDLKSGAYTLVSGLDTLESQVQNLPGGVKQLATGANTLKTALEQQFQPGAELLMSAAEQIAAGAKSGDPEHPGVYEAAKAISAGAEQIAAAAKSGHTENPALYGIYEAADGILTALKDIPSGTISASAAAVPDMTAPISALNDASTSLSAASQSNEGALASLESLLAEDSGLSEEQKAVVSAAVDTIRGNDTTLTNESASLTEVSTELSGLEDAGAPSAVAAEYSASDAVNTITALANQIKIGAETIAVGAKSTKGTSIYEAAEAISTGAEQIAAGAKSGHQEDPALYGIYEGAFALSAGVDTIISGNDGNDLDALIKGLNTLSGSSQALVSGVGQLSSGAGSLASGAGNAASGAGQLSAGANTLASGAQTLKSGTQSLTDGITQLVDGASALAEGMSTFDEEGIQTLSRLVEDDAQGFFDRLRALQDYAGEYTSFSGGVPGTPGTVKFIIRTDSIEES